MGGRVLLQAQFWDTVYRILNGDTCKGPSHLTGSDALTEGYDAWRRRGAWGRDEE